jgi:hypothetical protein
VFDGFSLEFGKTFLFLFAFLLSLFLSFSLTFGNLGHHLGLILASWLEILALNLD